MMVKYTAGHLRMGGLGQCNLLDTLYRHLPILKIYLFA